MTISLDGNVTASGDQWTSLCSLLAFGKTHCWTRWVRDPIQHETTHMLIKDLANVLNILYILTLYAGGSSFPGRIPLLGRGPLGTGLLKRQASVRSFICACTGFTHETISPPLQKPPKPQPPVHRTKGWGPLLYTASVNRQ